MRHITGDPDRPPARVAVSLTDYITGLYGAFGAVMAVMVARQTGKGQFVDSALYECAFSFMEPHIPAFEKLGHIANRAGPRLPDNTPNNLYPTGDGSFIHIAAVGEPVFRRFIAVLGRPELIDDPRFRTPVDRARNEDALDTIIEGWTTAHDLAALEKALQEADVPATRIFTMADIFGDPHYKARQAIVDAPDAEFGSVKMANVVPRLSATPGRVRHAGGQAIGGDTHAVLREVAGLSDSEIEALRKSGIVACAVAAKKAGSHVA
jgi:crotonobetainyl-CoA:carnitine CoA-transferase CaiB-like acyl-CoA transferase